MESNEQDDVLLEIWIANDLRRIRNIKRYEARKILRSYRASGEVKGFFIEPVVTTVSNMTMLD